MNKPLATKLHLLLLIGFAFTCGCSSGSVNSATATAQSQRASALATHIAVGLQTTSEAQTVQATATVLALQNALQAARHWPVILSDGFDANPHNWPGGQDSDPSLGSITWSIADGKYTWQAEAIDSFVWWATPDMEDISDFYLAANAQQLSGPDDGEYGLIFRQGGDSGYYLFEINNRGQLAVYLHQSDNWATLLSWTDSPAVHAGEQNRLEVLAQGSQLTFLVNDQFVASLEDTSLEQGKVGLLIGLTNPKDKAVWEFDNFELRSK